MKSIKKALLSCVTGVLSASAIVAPMSIMTSCANQGVMADESDQTNRISSNTYESMRRELDNLYYIKLKDKAYPEEIIEEKMAEMNQEMSYLDQKAQDLANAATQEEVDAQGMDFTALTQALSEESYKKYEIRLSRSSSAKWSNFVSYFNGLYESSYIYMRNNQFSEQQITERLKSAKTRFDSMFEDLKKEYFYDPLLGISKGIPQLIQCFEQCNAEIALVSAINRLSDFLSRYNFEFNANNPAVRYDKLKDEFKEGDKITDEWMQDIFTCRLRETGETVPFYGDGDQAILPNYVLTPYFNSFKKNGISNRYSMSIDWTIYPASYRNQPDDIRGMVTAHVYGDNEKIRNQEYDSKTTTYNQAVQESEVLYTDYEILPSAQYEAQELLNSYFNNPSGENIYFAWDAKPESPNNKYEYFFDGIKSGQSKGLLNQDSLASSGLKISDDNSTWIPLKNVIEEMKKEQESEEEDRPDEQLTLPEKFVKYVTLESNVEVIYPGSAHNVNHRFQYQYNNTSNGKDAIAVETNIRQTNGFLVSEGFFDKANEAFAKSAEVILKDYKNNKFKEILFNCNSLEANFISTSIMTAVQIVKNVIKMIFAGFATKLICTCVIIMLSANAVLLGLMWSVYTIQLIKPIKDFCGRVDTIREDPSFMKVSEKFSKDSVWFCQKDSSGEYDQEEYADKKDAFRKADFDLVTRPLYQYYTTLPYQTDFQGFFNVCIENECDPYTFYLGYNKWMYKGIAYLIIYGYSLLRFAINSVIMAWEPWVLKNIIAEFALEFFLGYIIQFVFESEVFHQDPKLF